MSPETVQWHRAPTEREAEVLKQVAERMLTRRDGLLIEVQEAALDAAPRFRADATLAAESRASTEANLMRWVTSTIAHPGEPVPTEAPLEALDLARSLVRRGEDLSLL